MFIASFNVAKAQTSSNFSFDTTSIIEAVRTKCWNALVGGRLVETVEECHNEAGRGDTLRHGYVHVSAADLARLHQVHCVDRKTEAQFRLAYAGAAGMDKGELHLFAHAHARMSAGDDVWVISSADKASVRAAVDLDWGDRMHSLEALAKSVGATPNPALDEQHTEAWLVRIRTAYRLGI